MKTTFIIALILTTHILFGQEKGLEIGFNMTIIQRSNSLTRSDYTAFDNVRNSNGGGFDIGLSLYYVFNDKFELRATPVLGFEEDKIVYTRLGSSEKLLFEPGFVKLPTHAIVTIHKKIPIGIVLGVTPSIQILQSDDAPTDKVELRKYDMSVDAGLNYPIHFPWDITFSPEIRYSKSLTNSAGDTRTEYGQAISSFYRDKFVFGFYVRSTIYR